MWMSPWSNLFSKTGESLKNCFLTRPLRYARIFYSQNNSYVLSDKKLLHKHVLTFPRFLPKSRITFYNNYHSSDIDPVLIANLCYLSKEVR